MCYCKRDTEHGIGTELAFIGSAIEFEHDLVDRQLVTGIEADEFRSDEAVDILNSFEDALAKVASFVAIAKLNSFVLTGAGTRRDGSAANDAGLEFDVDFNSRIATRVNDFAGADVCDDCAHNKAIFFWMR